MHTHRGRAGESARTSDEEWVSLLGFFSWLYYMPDYIVLQRKTVTTSQSMSPSSYARRDGAHWVTVWAATPQLAEDKDMPPPPFNEPDLAFDNTTIRQTLRLAGGGRHLRVRISNAFGLTDLHVTAVTIALPRPALAGNLAGSQAVLPGSLQRLSFGGLPSIIVPSAALALSDPLAFPVQARQVVTVSIFLRRGQAGGAITSHPGSRTQSWLCRGDLSAAAELPGSDAAPGSSLQSVFHWYFLSAVEAWGADVPQSCALALLGDSLTDGRCSTDNGNDRWPDQLVDRMGDHPFARNVAVINLAAGGSALLLDSKGPNVLSRLDRDVLAQPGVRYVLVFHGVNDIGTAAPDVDSQREIGERLVQGYRQIVARCHALGIPVFGATIGPFGAPDASVQGYSVPTRQQTRQLVNAWIRTSRAFDAVVDFDAVLRDPADPERLKPGFNSGDWLHPTVEVYRAMAHAFPLYLFEEFQGGVWAFE